MSLECRHSLILHILKKVVEHRIREWKVYKTGSLTHQMFDVGYRSLIVFWLGEKFSFMPVTWELPKEWTFYLVLRKV